MLTRVNPLGELHKRTTPEPRHPAQTRSAHGSPEPFHNDPIVVGAGEGWRGRSSPARTFSGPLNRASTVGVSIEGEMARQRSDSVFAGTEPRHTDPSAASASRSLTLAVDPLEIRDFRIRRPIRGDGEAGLWELCHQVDLTPSGWCSRYVQRSFAMLVAGDGRKWTAINSDRRGKFQSEGRPWIRAHR